MVAQHEQVAVRDRPGVLVAGLLRGGRVTVRFHLTSPLCPAKFAGAIGQDIRRKVAKLPGVEGVEVVLVDHFMAEALHRLINEGDRFAETRGVMRR